MRRRPCLIFLLPLAGLCCRERTEAAPPPPSVSHDEVRLPPASLDYLTIDTVRTRTERVVATLPAALRMDEDHTVRVLSPVAGRVVALEARSGDRVRQGQALARLASGDLAQAATDTKKADAALEQASGALARATDLYAHDVISQRELEQARSDEAQARAEAERAHQRVGLLGGATGVTTEYVLRAPIDGEVVERTANPGAEVRPDNPQPLFTLTSLDTLWLTVNAYQRDLPHMRSGQKLAFTTEAAPDRVFTATIRYVSSALDTLTRTALVRAVLPNRDRALRAEMFGEVKVLAADSSHTPVVPTSALVTREGQTVVFIEQGPGSFRVRPVTVAEDDGSSATVAEGLRPGELIVTHGALLLASRLSGH